jgi:hypothetical protein
MNEFLFYYFYILLWLSWFLLLQTAFWLWMDIWVINLRDIIIFQFNLGIIRNHAIKFSYPLELLEMRRKLLNTDFPPLNFDINHHPIFPPNECGQTPKSGRPFQISIKIQDGDWQLNTFLKSKDFLAKQKKFPHNFRTIPKRKSQTNFRVIFVIINLKYTTIFCKWMKLYIKFWESSEIFSPLLCGVDTFSFRNYMGNNFR